MRLQSILRTPQDLGEYCLPCWLFPYNANFRKGILSPNTESVNRENIKKHVIVVAVFADIVSVPGDGETALRRISRERSSQ